MGPINHIFGSQIVRSVNRSALLNPIQKISRQVFNKIIEIKNFNSIYSHVVIPKKTLVAIDYDNTIAEPKQTAGSDQSFNWRIKHYKNEGLSSHEAKEKALSEWTAIQNITEVRLVEPGIDVLIKNLQQSVIVMGLTTRSSSLSTCTGYQLEHLQIDLTRNPPSTKEIVFLNPREVLFSNGILFTSGTHKGESLFIFLEKVSARFDHIIFINDKRKNLTEVAETCNQLSINFTGLRYGFTDEKVAGFNPKIAAVQFDQFKKILSDEESLENF